MRVTDSRGTRFAFITLVFFVAVQSFELCAAFYDIDDSILYKVAWGMKPQFEKEEIVISNMGSSSVTLDPKDGQAETVFVGNDEVSEPDMETITMTTRNQERYSCTLPKPEVKVARESLAEDYKTPIELLEPLFKSLSCAYRLEHYWNYELCHGRFLRQFHEERVGDEIKVTQYMLGQYDKDKLELEKDEQRTMAAEGKTKKPKMKRIETMDMPYYEMVFEDGTACDINGKPRSSRIHYLCYPSGRHEMYSLKEISTCEYEVLVLSPLLCENLDYRPHSSNEQLITCKPASENAASKPLDLISLEAENLRLMSEKKMFEVELLPTDSIDTKKIVIKAVVPGMEKAEEDTTPSSHTAEEKWHGSRKESPKKLADPEIVKSFLKGEHCLTGGSGWWKYEFCYGKSVQQYHEENKVVQTAINLGTFNKEEHIQWIKKHPSKAPKPKGQRKYLYHFYDHGAICEETGKERRVEVKLVCKPFESPSAVSLYLLEPKTCQYVLGVESSLVCDILHDADKYGIVDEHSGDERTTPTSGTTVSSSMPISQEELDLLKQLGETTEGEMKEGKERESEDMAIDYDDDEEASDAE